MVESWNQYKSVYTIPREEFSLSKWSDLFNQYCSDCQAEKTHICIDDELSYNILSNIFVDEEEIIAAINKITPSESAGPDGIPGIMMRKCKSSISFPLFVLWNESVRTGISPK